MLGILSILEYAGKNQINVQKISIKGQTFLEIEASFKKDIKKVKKITKILNKNKITKICIKDEYKPYFDVFLFENHKNLFLFKILDIIKIYSKEYKTIKIIGLNINTEIYKILRFIPKLFDNIVIDFGKNTNIIADMYLSQWGISCTTFNLNECLVLCFTKPLQIIEKNTYINVSRENFLSVCDLECESKIYSKNTDVTAVFNALVTQDKKLLDEIHIKKLITKA